MKNIVLALFTLTFIVAGIFISGGHHADEHYQILEFISYKFNHTPSADLTWEFHKQMRPWFQVYLFQGFFSLLSFLGIASPFIKMTFLRVLMSLFGLLLSYKLYLKLSSELKDDKTKNFFFFISFSLWFLPYLYSRTSVETLAGFIFVLAFLSFYRSSNSIYHLVLSGVLFGLTFVVRFQMAVVIFALCLWALVFKKKTIKELFIVTLSFFVVMFLGILLDSYAYGSFSFVPWNYFNENILKGFMANISQEPWWWYFYQVQKKGLPVTGALIVLASLLFCVIRRKHPVAWIFISFVLFHSMITHKEYRFLFPLAPFLPFVLSDAFEFVLKFVKNKKAVSGFMILFIIVNFGAQTVSIFRPAFKGISFFQYLYDNPPHETIYYTGLRKPNEIIEAPTHFYQISNYSYQEVKDFSLVQEKSFMFHTWKGLEYQMIKERSYCKEIFPNFSKLEEVLIYGLKRKAKEDYYALFRCELP